MVTEKIKLKFSSHEFIEWTIELCRLREIKVKAIFFSYLKGRARITKPSPLLKWYLVGIWL